MGGLPRAVYSALLFERILFILEMVILVVVPFTPEKEASLRCLGDSEVFLLFVVGIWQSSFSDLIVVGKLLPSQGEHPLSKGNFLPALNHPANPA